MARVISKILIIVWLNIWTRKNNTTYVGSTGGSFRQKFPEILNRTLQNFE